MLEFLVIYRDLFMGFLRPGIFGFGGGPSSIPLIRIEVVDRYGWMTMQEFTDALAFGNMLPGPIATKMAALIGYHVSGIVGSLVAIIANIGPSAVAAILLISFYARFSETTWMSGMMTAVRPVVVILVAQVVLMMSRTSFTGIQTCIIAVATVLGLSVFRLHPAVLIVLALAYGGVFLK
ncbi:MAG: chromate transporter [Thermovirgaceae bacterium]